ncbi:MAG: lipocalin family protein [Porticoccaceae bacterium]
MNKSFWRSSLLVVLMLGVNPAKSAPAPMDTVDYVDLPRFMGDWYVIANIPTPFEEGAHNPVESYRLDKNGTIATTFTFNKDSFDGEKKDFSSRGFVKNKETNATWGMQFIWPIKADYRVIYLDPDYQYTVVGRKARDYLWIMARNLEIPDDKYRELVDFAVAAGYSADKIERAPHRLAN